MRNLCCFQCTGIPKVLSRHITGVDVSRATKGINSRMVSQATVVYKLIVIGMWSKAFDATILANNGPVRVVATM
jgi:hypothetical protein